MELSTVLSIAADIHQRMGRNYPHDVYTRAMAVQFSKRNFNFVEHQSFPLTYEDTQVGTAVFDFYFPDEPGGGLAIQVFTHSHPSCIVPELELVKNKLKNVGISTGIVVNYLHAKLPPETIQYEQIQDQEIPKTKHDVIVCKIKITNTDS